MTDITGDFLMDLIREIEVSFDSSEDIETKILEDLKEEIDAVLYERATTINTLADMWDDGDDDGTSED